MSQVSDRATEIFLNILQATKLESRDSLSLQRITKDNIAESLDGFLQEYVNFIHEFKLYEDELNESS